MALRAVLMCMHASGLWTIGFIDCSLGFNNDAGLDELQVFCSKRVRSGFLLKFTAKWASLIGSVR